MHARSMAYGVVQRLRYRSAMRNPLVVLGALLVTTGVAAAEPPGVTATASAAPQGAPETYVAVGAMLGMDELLDGQVAVDGGYHLRGSLWAHALVGTGIVGDDQGGGPVHQGRFGIEARRCTAPKGLLCGYTGVDLGYQTATWHSNEGNSMDEHHDDAIGVVRAGLDIGGDHVRVRPGVELYDLLVGSDTYSHAPGMIMGLNATLAVAYRW